jgi:hypothetical protein
MQLALAGFSQIYSSWHCLNQNQNPRSFSASSDAAVVKSTADDASIGSQTR